MKSLVEFDCGTSVCVHQSPPPTHIPMPALAHPSNQLGCASLDPTLSHCLSPGDGRSHLCTTLHVWGQEVLLYYYHCCCCCWLCTSVKLGLSHQITWECPQTNSSLHWRCDFSSTSGHNVSDAVSGLLLAFSNLFFSPYVIQKPISI